MPLAVAGVGAIGSLVGGIIGSGAASAAGHTIGAAGTAVGQSINQATGGAINAGYTGLTAMNNGLAQGQTNLNNYGSQQTGLYFDTNSRLMPYQDAGVQGAQGIQSMMQNYQPFQFDTSKLMDDPGLKFQMKEGMTALQGQAAARGMLQSGSNEKAMMNYSQGLASTYENQAYQQQLGQYQTNFTNQLQGMSSLANLGTAANSQAVQLGLGYGNQIGQQAALSNGLTSLGAQGNLQGNQWIGATGLQGSEAAGNAYIGGAQGTAAGQVGSANAWNGAIGGVANSAMGLGAMMSLPGASLTQFGHY